MILIPSALHALLSQLISPSGIPHTSILTSSAKSSGGSIISYSSIPPSEITSPFPRPPRAAPLNEEEEEEEEGGEGADEEESRAGMYTALAVGTWNEQRSNTQSSSSELREPLTLETEVGRISVVGVAGGKFLLVLVGTHCRSQAELSKMSLSTSSDSSAGSRALPPTRYFDILPPELLGMVIERVDQLPRQERQKALHSLTFVSKRVRSFAQPLLLERIYTSTGNGDNLLQLLLENNPNDSIAKIKTFHFDTPKLAKMPRWLQKLAKRATTLDELFVDTKLAALKPFLGANIAKLSICSMWSRIPFSPSKTSSLSVSPLRTDPLVCRLSILNSNSFSILVRYFITQKTAPDLQGVKHLYLEVSGERQSSSDLDPKELKSIESWTKAISESQHQLETLTLATSDQGGGVYRPHHETQTLIPALLGACRDRTVEVIWVERGRSRTFDDLAPQIFVERSEARHRS
ncbi:hypothetical protein JCM3765_000138 [Sporobolomyces pararoseus]